MRSINKCLVVGAGLLSAMSSFADAGEVMDESLLTLSLPLNVREEDPASPAPRDLLGRLEFRGVLDLGGDTYVTLLDTTTSRSRTLKIGEIVDGLRVASYSSEHRLIVIEGNGQQKQLTLTEAKIVAVGLPDPRSNPANSRYGGIRRRPGGDRPLLDSTPVVDQLAPR